MGILIKFAAFAQVLQSFGMKDFLKYDNICLHHLQLLRTPIQFDVICFAKGGGVTGQSEAVRLGISRCLDAYELKVMGRSEPVATDSEEEQEGEGEMPATWRKQLRQKGYLTRDARAVLRKRVGFKKARKRPQYSKR